MPATYGNKYGSTGKTNFSGPGLRTFRASWIASVEERTSKKGTRYLMVTSQKNQRFWVWHPPTIDRILNRKTDEEIVFNVKQRDGFSRLYTRDREPTTTV